MMLMNVIGNIWQNEVNYGEYDVNYDQGAVDIGIGGYL